MNRPQYQILLADDERDFRTQVHELLSHNGYDVESVADGAKALNVLQQKFFDAAILDIAMPKVDGLEVLEFMKERYPETEVIMVTGVGDVKTAVTSMKKGAFHYITKPFMPEELLQVLERAVEHCNLKRQASIMQTQLSRINDTMEMVGGSSALQSIVDLAHRVAPTDTSVLIQGASGTGKELIANFIYKNSTRSANPFVAINCASIPDTLIESELFGYEKGAFTDAHGQKQGLAELANNGTLFLDEVGDISPIIQPKLLRFIQTGEFRRVGGNTVHRVDVRIISASNKNLHEEVLHGRFREDLLYRLNVVTLTIPPLRDRKEDIPLLVQHFLEKQFPKGNTKTISPEAMALLMEYEWPGNIRELENVVEGSVIISRESIIQPEELTLPRIHRTQQFGSKFSFSDADLPLKEIERIYISNILNKFQWDKKEAAKILGISLKTLYTKIYQYHLLED